MANVMLNSIFWVLFNDQMYFGGQRTQSTTKYTKKRIEIRCVSFVFLSVFRAWLNSSIFFETEKVMDFYCPQIPQINSQMTRISHIVDLKL